MLAVRNLDKGHDAARRIGQATPGARVEVAELDLRSLASIHAAAEELKSTHQSIDLLINNAGVMFTPKSTTKDGFELQFGTNHLGHFAFTGLLLDHVLVAPGSRVVTVSSTGHRIIDAHPLRRSSMGARLQPVPRLWAVQAGQPAVHLRAAAPPRGGTNTIAAAAHPGGSNTELMRNLPRLVQPLTALARPFFQGADMGALPTLRAATDPNVVGGQYFGPDGFAEQRGYATLVSSNAASHDVDAQKRLWTVSEELTKVVYPVG